MEDLGDKIIPAFCFLGILICQILAWRLDKNKD